MNKWKQPEYELPNVNEEVEILASNDMIFRDMIVENKHGGLEWKHFSSKEIRAWRKITHENKKRRKVHESL